MSYTPLSSKTVVGKYDAAQLNVENLKPQWYYKLLNLYGDGLDTYELIKMTGGTTKVKNRTLYQQEEGAIERPIQVGAAIGTTAAGANFTFTLNASMYDTLGRCPLQISDSILIPPKYLAGSKVVAKSFRIYNRTGSAGAYTFYAQPPDVTTSITTQIPAGTYIALGAGSHAPGTGQPGGKTTTYYSRTFTTGEVKETIQVEGGSTAPEEWQEFMINGQPSILSRAKMEAQFRLNAKKDKAILFGEQNTNSLYEQSLVESGDSVTHTILGSTGVLQHMETRAQRFDYTSSLGIPDFDAVQILLEGQGVTDNEINCINGGGLQTTIENAGLSFIADMSHGTDLYNKMSGEMGIIFKRLLKNNTIFNFIKMQSFSNPQSYNVPDMGLYDLGMWIPNGKSKVKWSYGVDESEVKTIRNLELGYYANHEEDRTLVTGVQAGMTGINSSGNTDQYDRYNEYYLSEFMVIASLVNQWILARKVTG
jgi:hypothetical protein